MDPYINWLLGVCGVLLCALAALVYNRLGDIETLVRVAIAELRREDGVLHERINDVKTEVNDVKGRVVRLETRCDTYHQGAAK